MNKDKESKSKESTPRNEQEDKSGRQLKSLSQSEGPESWSTAESSVGSSARKRPSSWDDSDDESLTPTINSFNRNDLIYSGDSQKEEKSVAVEKNDIKAEYYKNLDAVDNISKPGNSNFEAKTCENVEEQREIKSKLDASDRRQSPARIRRRTRSSSSSSAVLEPGVECVSPEYKENFQILTPESYQYKAPRYQSYSSENSSLKAGLELDANYFLDHIFTELRTNITGLVSLGEESSLGKGSREREMLDLESCSVSNIELLKSHDLARTFSPSTYNPNLKTLKSFVSEEPIAFIHKTSRKLSQILEVEETKKSQERNNFSEEEEEEEEEDDVQLFEMSPFLWTNPQKPPDVMTSPFPTSNDGEENGFRWTSIIPLRGKLESPTLETFQLSPKNTGRLEKLREKEKPENQTKEELFERFHNLFPYSDSDSENIIFLTEKRGKTQLGSNPDQQEGNNCDSLKDYEKVKHLDEIEREASETKNVNFESEKDEFGGENPGPGEENSESADAEQKNSRHVGQNSHEEKIPNLRGETTVSCSEGSTPRGSSRHSLRKISEREREPDFRLESSSIQSQKLTPRSLKTEEGTLVNSSRESPLLSKDDYIRSKSGETSKGSSQRTCDNLSAEIVEGQLNLLNIDLEKVCSNSNTPTESNSSSSRTFTQEEIKDWTFRTNSSDRSALSSHTSEPHKNQSSKKMKYYLSDGSHHNRSKTGGSKTDRPSKPQKMSSRSLKGSEAIFRKLERSTEYAESCAFDIRERQTSANSKSKSTTAGKRKPSETYETGLLSRNSTNSCSSGVSEGRGVRFAQLKDPIEDQESTISSRQRDDDVTTTVENVISEKINSSRSEKAVTQCNNDKSFQRKEGVGEGLCERQREETMGGEDSKRNLFSIQKKDDTQEDSKSWKKDGGTVRNTVSSEQFSEDVMAIDKSKKCLGEESSRSYSSAKSTDIEPTISVDDISYSLEKIEIDLDTSGREKKGAKTRLSNETLSVTCAILEKSLMDEVKIFSEGTSNESFRCTKTKESQRLNEKLKSTNSNTSLQKTLGHETPKKSMASKPVFQDKLNGETWNKLIDAFDGTQKSDRSLDNKFPGFPSLNQKGFTEHDRQETQEFFLYEPDEVNEFEDFFTLSRRLIEDEEKSCLRFSKGRELKGNQLPESLSSPLEHSEGTIIFKSDQEKSVQMHDSKRRNFEIGEFGDGNCWHDGKPDISEPEKPQNHGDGNREKRKNWETLVLRLEDNKEEKTMKSGRYNWVELEGKASQPSPPKNKSFSGKESNADLGSNLISHNLNYSKSENSLSKMRSQQKTDESGNSKTLTDTTPMKRKSNRESVSNSSVADCSEREHQVGRAYFSDESQLIYGEKPRKNLERMDTVASEMDNRKQEKESTNINIFLAGRKKEKALVKANNWLIIKNQEGKQSRQQKEKIRKLKKKLKKSEKLNLSKEPFCTDENATGKMPAFVPALKFGDTGCLQNFYKRLFSICCLTSNSSAATSA